MLQLFTGRELSQLIFKLRPDEIIIDRHYRTGLQVERHHQFCRWFRVKDEVKETVSELLI